MILGWLCLCLFVDYASTSKIEVKLYPPTIHLHGRGARHRLLLVEEVNDQAVGQPSGDWKFESSVPETVTIVDGDIALALKDGEATISARSPTGLHITSSIHVKISGTAKEEPPGFERDVIPVLTKLTCNTGSCHGSMAGKGGLKLSLRGYDPESDYFAIARQAFQRRVDLRHPEQSLLLLKPLGLLSHGGGQKLETDTPEYETLLEWIKSGVPEHEKQPVVLKSINAYPPRIRLTPQKSMPLLVQALYSDGRTVDVARRARFASSEDQLMKVTEDGLVTAKGSGAGGVSILHGNQVALVPVVSPFESTDVKMQKLLANNFIDQHINGRLYELNLPASPVCSDQEFIRRAYIDAIGCLPTPEELDRYFQDTSQDKRSKLIDELLARPEYVDYWTNKWADLFLISTKKLPGSNVWAFHQYLKQAVADNRPWNVLAREILTSTGSNLVNGATNYFVMHKDITDLTETTAVTFLGTSITCARCHNHPLDKWTQDQYWAMANLLVRVGHKPGSRANEVIVHPLVEGEALHLRRQKPMKPAPVDGPEMELESTVDRRLHLAEWLTAADNPLFARAIINRIWRNFMGRGLVESEDDHRPTNPPSHPELMLALEKDFIQNGYNMKRLVNLIMNSISYQRSSQMVPGNEEDEKFYSRYLHRRMKAEVILDAYSQVLNVPTEFTMLESGGRDATTRTTDYPLGTKAMQLPDTRIVSQFLTAFGRPEREQVCACERESDATVAQALHVYNGSTLNEKLQAKHSRLDDWQKLSDEAILNDLFLRSLSRTPTAEEKRKYLAELKPGVDRRLVHEDWCWAVLTSKEFLFNH